MTKSRGGKGGEGAPFIISIGREDFDFISGTPCSYGTGVLYGKMYYIGHPLFYTKLMFYVSKI